MDDTDRVHSRPYRSFQVVFRRLAWAHWAHAALLFELIGTGAFLYFPNLRTEFIEYHQTLIYWHLTAAFLYIGLLLFSLRSIFSYIRKLPKRIGKRLHLSLVYAAGVIWFSTGWILWRIHDFPVSYREPAIRLHDLLSAALIPWASTHIAWVLTKRSLHRKGKQKGNLAAERQDLRSSLRFTEQLLTRRQFLFVAIGAAASLSAGILTKWLWPALPKLQVDSLSQKGSFRIYNVAPKIPTFQESDYRLLVEGLVEHPLELALSQLRQMTQMDLLSDFYCVTGWSVENVRWTGVPLSALLELAKPLPNAKFLTVYSFDGLYSDSYTWEQVKESNIVLALKLNGFEIPAAQGAPCRILFPRLYGYKSVKWVNRIELTAERRIGYWEQRGYDLNGELPR